MIYLYLEDKKYKIKRTIRFILLKSENLFHRKQSRDTYLFNILISI